MQTREFQQIHTKQHTVYMNTTPSNKKTKQDLLPCSQETTHVARTELGSTCTCTLFPVLARLIRCSTFGLWSKYPLEAEGT